MSRIAAEVLLIVGLVVLNGVFAMSEIALVSSRRARLQQRADAGDAGARRALAVAEEPTHFLSTVQIGITLIGILAGAYGGGHVPAPGEHFDVEGWRIEVVDMDGNRVDKVLASSVGPGAS